MRKTFLIHKLAEIYLAVETTGVGAKPEFMPSVQFTSWNMAVEYFKKLGATDHALAEAKKALDSTGHAQLVI
jgi:hypothetical protein